MKAQPLVPRPKYRRKQSFYLKAQKAVKRTVWYIVMSVIAMIMRVAACSDTSTRGRVGKGISALAAHGTVLDSLPSYGSCYPNQTFIPNSQW
jgi:hypothetical protein